MATANHDDFAFRLQFARHQQREIATEKKTLVVRWYDSCFVGTTIGSHNNQIHYLCWRSLDDSGRLRHCTTWNLV